MPIDNVNTQAVPQQPGVIAKLLQTIGAFAGKNKLRETPESSAHPLDPPKYEEGFWDSLYGGQGNRINAAGKIDQYNRQAHVGDAQKIGQNAEDTYVGGQKQMGSNLTKELGSRSRVLGDAGRTNSQLDAINEGDIDAITGRGSAGEVNKSKRDFSLKGLATAMQALGNDEVANQNKGIELGSRNQALRSQMPALDTANQNSILADQYKSTAQVNDASVQANPEMAAVSKAIEEAKKLQQLGTFDAGAADAAGAANLAHDPAYRDAVNKAQFHQLSTSMQDPLHVIPHDASAVMGNNILERRPTMDAAGNPILGSNAYRLKPILGMGNQNRTNQIKGNLGPVSKEEMEAERRSLLPNTLQGQSTSTSDPRYRRP